MLPKGKVASKERRGREGWDLYLYECVKSESLSELVYGGWGAVCASEHEKEVKGEMGVGERVGATTYV